MSKTVLWKALLGVLTMLAVAGCATLANNPPVDQKAGVKQALEQWKHGMETKNLDELMAVISAKSFTSSDYGDFVRLKSSLQASIADGGLDNIKVNFDDAQFVVEDEKATVYPVTANTDSHKATFSFQLRREDGKWVIVNMERD